jgi:ATP-dependent DNA ligase
MIAAGCTIGAVIEQPPMTVARQWRPQGFGAGKTQAIPDPIIEPVWIGDRVLVHIEGDAVAFVHDDGEPVEPSHPGLDAIADELTATLRAETVVLDGYLTHQATMPPKPVPGGGVETPSAAEMTTQMFFGRRTGRKDVAKQVDAERAVLAADTPLAFVAVDLLAIDGTELLAVPLLERKRLLESALDEGELVRRTAYVRPPVDVWLGTWRLLGFTQLVYKAANGRYTPGVTNDGWALARIPQH